MATSKIIKYNLQDEAKQLKDMGYTNEEISRKLGDNHPEIKELKKLSGMSVGRFFKSDECKEIEEKLLKGENPVTDFITEYRDRIEKIENYTLDLYEECKTILADAKLDGTIIDKLKAVDMTLKSLEQSRKNMVSLVQYGERQTNNFYNVNLKKEYHIKNLLLNFSEKLCPKCRSKIPELLGI